MFGENNIKLEGFFSCFVLIFFYTLFTFDRQNTSGGGAERDNGDTESEAGSKLWAVSTEPDAGLELTNHEVMTWAKVGRLTD